MAWDATRRSGRFVAPAFEEQYPVVLLDLMGSGLSNTANYTKEKYASLDGHAGERRGFDAASNAV